MNMQHCLQIFAEAFKLYALFLFTVLAVIYMSIINTPWPEKTAPLNMSK